ncbi:antibiotic biosynthesis monooxygenase [Sutcliffiella halmapala]|uniref:antibiotic biosynthesis monooxygenase n=1 Tax=Sutcliffiella halmapala TaxID=79882 RepID=UPI00099504A5|nr:antibiotic biosynthesis monooxygenase [Sutcliffiella halmapala]
MITRIWHGWTTLENATTYEKLLKQEIFPSIEKKNIEGYQSIQLLMRPHEDEVEFITVMSFDSWEAIKQFVGEDFSISYVPAKARGVLSRWDERAQHYETLEFINYQKDEIQR